MLAKTVSFVAFVFFMSVFPVSVSGAGGAHHGDGHKSEKSGWMGRILGKSDSHSADPHHDKHWEYGGDWHHNEHREHGKRAKCGHDSGKHRNHEMHHGKRGKCGHRAKSGGSGAFWWRSPEIVWRLRLEDSQIEKMDEISASYYKRMTAAYERMYDAKAEFYKIKRNAEASSKQIMEAAKEKYAAKMDKKLLKMQMRLEMREVLTVQQRRELPMMKVWGRKKRCSGKY